MSKKQTLTMLARKDIVDTAHSALMRFDDDDGGGFLDIPGEYTREQYREELELQLKRMCAFFGVD